MIFRVATYNIHSSRGPDGRRDTRRILGVVREIGADLIALQELDGRGATGIEAAPLEYLAAETGTESAFVATLRDEGGGSYGHGLLSKLPADRVERIDVSVPGREPRFLLEVRLRFAAGNELRVVALHLGLQRAERARQIEHLLNLPGADPTVVLGDSNEWNEYSRNLGRIRAVFGRERRLASYPTRFPVLALDRLWVSPPAIRKSAWTHRTEFSLAASDHLPVVAEIELPDPYGG